MKFLNKFLCALAVIAALAVAPFMEANEIRSFPTGGALTAGARVCMSGANVVVASITDEDVGTSLGIYTTTQNAAIHTTADGELGDYVASGAITAGADVYPDTLGNITATVQGKRIGKATNATTNSGDICHVIKLCPAVHYTIVTVYIAAATVSEFVFIADRAYTVVSIKEIHSVVSTSGTCAVRKITGVHLAGAAVGTGVVELLSTTTGFDLSATVPAGTVTAGTLSATASDYNIATNDAIAINIQGTMTGLVGGNVTIILKDK